jgi:hypothetical protein
LKEFSFSFKGICIMNLQAENLYSVAYVALLIIFDSAFRALKAEPELVYTCVVTSLTLDMPRPTWCLKALLNVDVADYLDASLLYPFCYTPSEQIVY